MVAKNQGPEKAQSADPAEPKSAQPSRKALNIKLILLLLFAVIIIIGVAVIILTAGAGYVFFSGYLQTPTTITSEIQTSVSQCQGNYSYIATLSSASGPVSDQTIYVYANGDLIEQLKTDKDGRINSTKDFNPEWCGKKIDFSFNYTGDLFHRNASNASSIIIRQPLELIAEIPNETEINEPVQLNLKLVKTSDNSIVGGKVITISGDVPLSLTTNYNGSTQTNLQWSSTGTKTITAYFEGDEFYEASNASASVVVYPACASFVEPLSRKMNDSNSQAQQFGQKMNQITYATKLQEYYTAKIRLSEAQGILTELKSSVSDICNTIDSARSCIQKGKMNLTGNLSYAQMKEICTATSDMYNNCITPYVTDIGKALNIEEEMLNSYAISDETRAKCESLNQEMASMVNTCNQIVDSHPDAGFSRFDYSPLNCG